MWNFEDVTYPMRIKRPTLDFIDEAYEKAEERDIELLNDLPHSVTEKVKRGVDMKRDDLQRHYDSKMKN